MDIGCELKIKKDIPSELREVLERYYASVLKARGKSYAEARWNEMVKSTSLVFYRIFVDGKTHKDSPYSFINELKLIFGGLMMPPFRSQTR